MAEKVLYYRSVTNIDANDDETVSWFWDKTARSTSSTTETVDKDTVEVYDPPFLFVDQWGIDNSGRFIRSKWRAVGDGSTLTQSDKHIDDNIETEFGTNLALAEPVITLPSSGSDGKVQLRGYGGDGDYTFDIDYPNSPNSTGYYSGLSSGSHTYKITDGASVVVTGSFTIPVKNSFGKRFTLEFDNQKGNTVTVDIYYKDYSGSVLDITGTGEPLIFNLDVSDSNDFTVGNAPLSISLNLLETTADQLSLLISAVPGDVYAIFTETTPLAAQVYKIKAFLASDITTIKHADLPRPVSFRFTAGMVDFTAQVVVDFTGQITGAQFLAWVSNTLLNHNFTFKQYIGIRPNELGSGYSNVFTTVYFDAEILNGMSIKSAVQRVIDIYGANVVPSVQSEDYIIYTPEAIYKLGADAEGSTIDEVGLLLNVSNETSDLRQIKNPDANEIMYFHNTQQYEILKQVKQVTVNVNEQIAETHKRVEVKWDDTTLLNYTDSNGTQAKHTEVNEDGIEIEGIALVHSTWDFDNTNETDLDYIKSTPFQAMQGAAVVELSYDAEAVFRTTPASDVDENKAQIVAQVVVSDNDTYNLSLDADGEFENGLGSFCRTTVSEDGKISASFKGTLPTITGSDKLMSVILYHPLVVVSPNNTYNDLERVIFSNVKLVISPVSAADNQVTLDINDTGNLIELSTDIVDAPNVAASEYIFKNGLIYNGATTDKWYTVPRESTLPVATPASLGEVIGQRIATHREQQIKRLSATLFDSLPDWNTYYYDATILGIYFIISNYSYSAKRSELNCVLLENIIEEVSEYRLLEDSETRLLESGDSRKLE
ncbi:MAG: hypothetical protein DRQ56_04335 [Gammaproteobacteria bacterium]|nr:MAG: hypothetical protein DRQ56_04335 [Gammaproteobacteria bacterium]